MLRIRRGETPFYRGLRTVAQRVRSSMLPIPRFLHPLLRLGFNLQQSGTAAAGWLFSYFVREPLFRGRCERVGRNFRTERIPYVFGHTKICIGDNVTFFGKVHFFSGRIFDEPRVVLGNRVELGHNVIFTVNREIVVEDDVNISSDVRLMDTDSHPHDTAERIADLPPRPEEVKPVRVGRYAWIGQGAFILKGVTIGEGAIIGANSVVISDIPPYCVAMGNPARVVVKNINQSAAAATTPVSARAGNPA
ncbi:MAG TPA: acyltransferase [Candidatus Binatia bacterium]|nr:acyltransferase [Candidatus Binatia bacterium]